MSGMYRRFWLSFITNWCNRVKEYPDRAITAIEFKCALTVLKSPEPGLSSSLIKALERLFRYEQEVRDPRRRDRIGRVLSLVFQLEVFAQDRHQCRLSL